MIPCAYFTNAKHSDARHGLVTPRDLDTPNLPVHGIDVKVCGSCPGKVYNQGLIEVIYQMVLRKVGAQGLGRGVFGFCGGCRSVRLIKTLV